MRDFVLGLGAAVLAGWMLFVATGDGAFSLSCLALYYLCSPYYAAAMWAAAIVSVWAAASLGTEIVSGVLAAQLGFSLLFAFRGTLVHPLLRPSAAEAPPERLLYGLKLVLALVGAYFGMLVFKESASLLFSAAFFVFLMGLYRGMAGPPLVRQCVSAMSRPGNLAALVVSGCIGLALVETGARLFFPDLRPPAQCFQWHPEYLYTTTPNTSEIQTILEEKDQIKQFHVAISSQGFRDREYPAKEDGEFLILALGDSYTFGLGLEIEETYPKVLESMLREAHPEARISVLNAGVSGYGTWQERGFLLERGLPLEPDLVVLQTFILNDLEDNLRKEGRLLRAFPEDFVEMMRDYRFKSLWQVRLERWTALHSKTYRVLRDSTKPPFQLDRFLSGIRWMPIKELPPPPRSDDRLWFMESHLAEWYPELDDAWVLMREEMAAMRALCEGRGIDFMVFNVPVRFAVCDWEWEAFGNFLELSLYDRTKCERLIREYFRESGMDYVAVLEPFLDHPNSRSLYFPHDGHLSPEGSRFLAGLLRDHLAGTDFWAGDSDN